MGIKIIDTDIGYYLGCELVKRICETRDVKEVLNLSLYEVEKELYACISSK